MKNPQPDPYAQTRGMRTQPPVAPGKPEPVYLAIPRKRRSNPWRTGCLFLLLTFGLLVCFSAIYLLAPLRTNILLLGIDRAPEGTDLSRTDTNILVTVVPTGPYIGMLSIPRDLWVNVPSVGENRINTAHFFAENAVPGSGPQAALETVRQNFGVDVEYYIRIRFDGLQEVVEALGGVDVELETPMSGYPAGVHHMDGEQALAFVRDRSGSDDFFRMSRGQLFLKEILKQIFSPRAWPRLPAVAGAIMRAVDTNLAPWQYPRLALALLRAGPDGIDSRVISRDMVTPFTTSGGAQVLLPNWDLIHPVVEEMFQ